MSEQNNMSEEEYLKKHLGSLESSKNQNNSDIPFVEQPKIDSCKHKHSCLRQTNF